MAKPDLDDGFFQVAHELDAALAVADFTKGARIVLREVFSQIFYPAFRKAATLSPSDIAKRTGVLRPNVARAIKELVDSGVLQPLDDGTFAFVKDYERWTRAGAPRLSETERAYCRHAVVTAESHRPPDPGATPGGGRSGRIQRDNTSTKGRINPDTQTVSNEIRDRINPDTQTVSNEIRFRGSPQTPLLGREEEQKREQETSSSRTTTTEGGVPRSLSRPIQNDPAEVARVARWASALPGREIEDLGIKVDQFAASYPVAWIEDAILCGVAGSRPGRTWGYAHKCLMTWWQAGKPNLAEVEAAREAQAPATIPLNSHASKAAAKSARMDAMIDQLKERFDG